MPLSLVALIALVAQLSLFAVTPAAAQSAAAIAMEPVSLPDMAIGSRDAPITIIDYSSMTCSHCAHFEQGTLPMLKSTYIDTGYVRFVFREFPLDNNAFGDPGRYFGAIDTLFRQQEQLVNNAMNTLRWVGEQSGMSDSAIDTCLKDQDLYAKLVADEKIGANMVKIDSTPTFIINGRVYKGYMSFEQMDGIIRSQLRR
jgi:protein-disulfide isomerase